MKNILLTGTPRAGKTTIILKIAEQIGKNCAGFYTEEIRRENSRVGFRLMTIKGIECTLAHKGIKSRYRVGKYRINIECIKKTGTQAIKRGIQKGKIIIIDEIGKMELFSNAFKESVIRALDSDSKVIGTILYSRHPFCDKIKERKDVEVIEVTEHNRDTIPSLVIEKLSLL